MLVLSPFPISYSCFQSYPAPEFPVLHPLSMLTLIIHFSLPVLLSMLLNAHYSFIQLDFIYHSPNIPHIRSHSPNVYSPGQRTPLPVHLLTLRIINRSPLPTPHFFIYAPHHFPGSNLPPHVVNINVSIVTCSHSSLLLLPISLRHTCQHHHSPLLLILFQPLPIS